MLLDDILHASPSISSLQLPMRNNIKFARAQKSTCHSSMLQASCLATFFLNQTLVIQQVRKSEPKKQYNFASDE